MKKIDLLNGSIFEGLLALAIPIMLTSLINMAYNMIDMIWLGRLSTAAVSAVGAAGMYMWLGQGLATLARMGGQVKLGHAIGANDQRKAIKIVEETIKLGLLFGIIFGTICIFLNDFLIGFFKFESVKLISDARYYLIITCGFVVFSYLNQIFSGLLTATGNSKTSFKVTTIGLILNIVLDPILIFNFKLGVVGAGLATVISQIVVTLFFIYTLSSDESLFAQIKINRPLDLEINKEIIAIGLPTAIQSMLFTGIAMIIARLVASYGDEVVGIQKVGSQIESISWMIAEGFQGAVNSFISQNIGAQNYRRVRSGYKTSIIVMSIWGLFTTFALVFFAKEIFMIFITESSAVVLGIDYLKILGYSQLFMCLEITTAGAFSGKGKTLPPSVISIVFNAARIPLAFYLTQTELGLNGIWWALTISSIIKGITLMLWYHWDSKNDLLEKG